MKQIKLNNLCVNITDGKHGDCRNEPNSGFYFISCKDVIDGKICYNNARQINKEDFEEADKRTKLAPNDILITNSGTIGRMAIIKEVPEVSRTTFQKSVAIIKPNKDIVVPYYLYYLLKNVVGQLINNSNGSAQKNLLLSTLRNFEICYIPKKDIQQRIASILSRYDDLIENYQQQIKLLEEAAQRLYKEWFVDLHFPGYENTKIVDGVPEGWKKKTVKELGMVITGKTPSTSNKSYYGGRIPFITIPDMHSGVYPQASTFLSEEGANTQKGKYLPKNCLMVSCIGTAGLVCISREVCQTNQQINSLSLTDNRMLYFMYFTFKLMKEHLHNIGSNGATMTNVNKSKFENIEIILPLLEFVELFQAKTKAIFATIRTLSSQINLLTEARDRLLPKLMSGEIEV